MKAEDMVMVIENRKGHETNSLLTFDLRMISWKQFLWQGNLWTYEAKRLIHGRIGITPQISHFMPESVQIVRRLVIFCVEPLMMIRTFDLMKISAVKNAWKNFAAEE